MGTADRTRARAALDAVSDKHRAFSAAVGAAAAWAAAVASRTRQEADDVAWRRVAAERESPHCGSPQGSTTDVPGAERRN